MWLESGKISPAAERIRDPLPRAARVDQAWDLRLGGRVDEAYDLYLDLLGEMNVRLAGISIDEAWQLLLEKGVEVSEALELLLLDISFLRNRREIELAERKCERLGKLAEAAGTRVPASYLLQSALNAFAAGSHSLALERFLQSKRRAQNPREHCLASFNALLCMEDLGLEFGPSLESFLESFSPHEQKLWARSIHGQLDALRLRAAFRSGDFDQLRQLIPQLTRGEQTLYFAAWAAELPHLGFPELASGAKERFARQIATSGMGYHSAFRLRTLNGLLVEEDLGTNVKLSEKIERLYLWVWRWLARPDSSSLEKILLLQHSIRRQGRVLAGDDYRLLVLSLRWLGLFGGLTSAELDRITKGFSAAESRLVPQFHKESRLLDVLFALRDGSRFAGDMKQSLLDESFGCAAKLAKLFSGEIESLSALSASIRALDEAQEDKCGIRVELLKRRVLCDGEEILSEPLTKLFELFRSTDRANKAQALSHIFGIRRLEPGLHDQKLANLLSKANRQFPGIAQFSTKGDQVIARIQREKIHFAESDEHTLAFTRVDITLLLDQQEQGTGREENDFSHLKGKWLSRSDIESALGVSRATAARWLKTRTESGAIEMQGTGKNVRYKIVEVTL